MCSGMVSVWQGSSGAKNPVASAKANSMGENALAGLVDIFDQTTSRYLADAIIDSSDDAIIAKTLDGIIRSWNHGARAMFGYEPDEIIGRPVLVLIPPERLEEEHMILSRVIRGERVDHFETVRIHKDGTQIDTSVTVSPIRNSDGAIIGASKIARDITFQKTAQQRLLKAANVFTYSGEAIAITDEAGTIIEINDAFCSISGFSQAEVLGCPIESFLKIAEGVTDFSTILGGSDYLRVESTGTKKNGDGFVARATVTAVKSNPGRIDNFIFLIADITELREQQRRLEEAALLDPLTGLPNRRSLVANLETSMARCAKSNGTFAIAFVDLDGFKQVNDVHGHEAGDHFLTVIGERLSRALREGDFLARIGGDEFVAILQGVGSPQDCWSIGKRLLKASSTPVVLDGAELSASCSIGVSFFNDAHARPEMLLNEADRAMYAAKQHGKNQIRYAGEAA